MRHSDTEGTARRKPKAERQSQKMKDEGTKSRSGTRRSNPASWLRALVFQFFSCRLCVLCVSVAHFSPCALASQPPPNVVLVISDDQRWDCLGAAGNHAIVTPAQDRMAREGVWFRQATIHVPQCSPSRATLLTGLTPHQHGWFSNQTQD